MFQSQYKIKNHIDSDPLLAADAWMVSAIEL